jgi:hypothetical protein
VLSVLARFLPDVNVGEISRYHLGNLAWLWSRDHAAGESVGDRSRKASTGKMGEKEEYLSPKAAEHDYDAFRRLISTDLPKTYKERLRLMEQASLLG